MDNLEYIDHYFTGQLNDQQKADFDRLILSEPSFAEKVAFYVSTHHLLKQELEEEKKGRFREIFEQNKTAPARASVRRLWASMAAVAAVLIVITALWWTLFRTVNPHQLAENYLHNELRQMSVNMGSRQDSIQKAKSLFNKGKLPEALRQFQQLIENEPNNEEAIRFAGIICLHLKEYDKALLYFQRSENIPGLYSNPGKFYQALTLMERDGPGDAKKAKLLLQQVVDQDLDYKKEAQQILKKW